MNSRLHKDLRRVLRSHIDGLTARDLSERLNRNLPSVYNALKVMPDAYITSWGVSEITGHLVAVWKVVVPPPNAVKPTWTK